MKLRRLLAAVSIVAVVATACTSSGDDDASGSDPSDPSASPVRSGPLGVRLSQGRSPAAASVPVADGTPLDLEAIEAVLSRLDDTLPTDGGEDFVRPPETLQPPLTGPTVDVPFGATEGEAAPSVDDGPLEVLRVQPDGDVDVAPFVSITFDRPMVPVGTLDQLDAADVPARISPAVDGRWRWIGTRTLRFDPDDDRFDRLPMATEYTVTIPAGTIPAGTRANGDGGDEGAALADDVEFTFATPGPQVRSITPDRDVTGDRGLTTRPVFVIVTDQIVDPDAVLDATALEADGDGARLRLASRDEIAADADARAVVDRALDGRWVAVTPTDALPNDADLRLTVAAGFPSAEGPRTAAEPATATARTFGAFRVVEDRCWNPCTPESSFALEFSNAIDRASVDIGAIETDPAIPGMRVGVYGNVIDVSGQLRGNTTYDLTLPDGIADEFGQSLSGDRSFSFDVGPAAPAIEGVWPPIVTTDPFADAPTVPIVVATHERLRVRALAVEPDDMDAFVRAVERSHDADGSVPTSSLPGGLVADEEVETGVDTEGRAEFALPVAGYLDEAGDEGSAGHVVLWVEPTVTYARDGENFWRNRPVGLWVQRTTIALDVFTDHDEVLVWATDLRDGTVLPGVAVAAGSSRGTTGADGTVRLAAPSSRTTVTGTLGDATAVAAQQVRSHSRFDRARWFIADDRGLYRPGETVSLTGFVRRWSPGGGVNLRRYPADTAVAWTLHDNRGVELAAGDATLDAAGAFSLTAALPEGVNLGEAQFAFSLPGRTSTDWGHSVVVQDYRTPEFEVTAAVEGESDNFAADATTVSATAAYLSGGPLRDADVTWTVSTADTTYRPAGWDGWTFGVQVPWWYSTGRGFDDIGCCFPPPVVETSRYDGRTDAAGRHLLQVDLTGERPDLPVSVRANAAVTDVNRQSFAGNVDVLVHPGRYYAGLRSQRTFVPRGEDLAVDVIVTDVAGAVVPGRLVTVTAERVQDSGFSTDDDDDVTVLGSEDCEVTSSDEAVTCRFGTDDGGRYRITAVVADDADGTSRTELTRWVTGDDVPDASTVRSIDAESVTIIPNLADGVDAAPGDDLELLVQAPFAGSGLVTLSNDDLHTPVPFTVAESGTATVTVPLRAEHSPRVSVRVDVVGAAARAGADGDADPDLPPRPAFATGTLDLAVTPTQAILDVDVTPAAPTVRPGTSTAVDVVVRDHGGAPAAGASVSVFVVDDAVLGLVGRAEAPDPLDVMAGAYGGDVGVALLRDTVRLSDTVLGSTPEEVELAEAGTASGGATASAPDSGDDEDAAAYDTAADGAFAAPAANRAAGAPIEVRDDFRALAHFAPQRTTDAAGSVRVEFALPDNLTRYRIVAVAAHDDARFGTGESTLVARLPVQARPSAPRFLNFGDDASFPVVVRNQTTTDGTFHVVFESTNLGADDPAGLAVNVPAEDRVEVRFPVTATTAGTARYRVTVVDAADPTAADSATGEIPVYTPVTTEAFATYGVLDGSTGGGSTGDGSSGDTAMAQRVLTPAGVVGAFGGLDVSMSSTALSTLTDAVIDLSELDYESVTAHAERLVALVALRDVLDAFDAEGLPDPAAADRTIDADIAAIVRLQNGDGGFGWWTRERSQVQSSLQATHALVAAEAAGRNVPAGPRGRALDFLADIDSHLDAEWSTDAKQSARAYALYVLDLAGRDVSAEAAALHREGDLPTVALAWLWTALDDGAPASTEIGRTFANRVVETPGAATFADDIAEDAHVVLSSDRRTTGIALAALLERQPDSDLIPKLVTGLIGNRIDGHWGSSQENAFVLLALRGYFDAFEAQDPDFVARTWLDDLYAAESTFTGRSTRTDRATIPMVELTQRDDPTVVVANDGTGRLYYRLGLRYAPDDLRVDPRDEGFVVARTYEPVDGSGAVTRRDDGSWQVDAGAEVRVRLTMVADAERVNLALVDHLPAGFETVNPTLAAAPALPPDPETDPEFDAGPHAGPDAGDDAGDLGFGRWADSWWWGPWYRYQNLRDDRTEAIATYLQAGTYEYSYIARATTPGTFTAPPAEAEEIYAPEVFGRSASDTVHVVDAG